MVAPFKEFLSPKHRFFWNDELEAAFEDSKAEIMEVIKHWVQIFDPEKTTVLNPDWSISGVGYFLFQKHCSCPGKTTDCCTERWCIVVAGS